LILRRFKLAGGKFDQQPHHVRAGPNVPGEIIAREPAQHNLADGVGRKAAAFRERQAEEVARQRK
jgi:hypothetical protein